MEKKYLESIIEDLNREIAEIRALKKPISKSMEALGGKFLAPSYNNIHLISLMEKLNISERTLEELEGVTLLKTPFLPSHPVSTNILMYLVVANILTLVFATVVTIYQRHIA